MNFVINFCGEQTTVEIDWLTENSEQKTKNRRRTGTRQRTGKEQTSQNEETILQLLPLSPLCSLPLSLSTPNGRYNNK